MRFWRGINVKGIFGQHFLDFRNICHWNHIHPLSIHPSIVCNCFIPFMGARGVLLEPIPAVSGRGQGTPWTSCQLIAGPSLMAEAATQAATSGAIWGSVSFAWSLQHEAQLSPWGARIRTSDPLITSRPALPAELQPPKPHSIQPIRH